MSISCIICIKVVKSNLTWSVKIALAYYNNLYNAHSTQEKSNVLIYPRSIPLSYKTIIEILKLCDTCYWHVYLCSSFIQHVAQTVLRF